MSPGHFSPTKEPPVRTQQKAGWAPETVRFGEAKKLLTVPCWGKAPFVMNTCSELHDLHSSELILIACTVQLLLFCTLTNQYTIISQIITLLHVSTLSVIFRDVHTGQHYSNINIQTVYTATTQPALQ